MKHKTVSPSTTLTAAKSEMVSPSPPEVSITLATTPEDLDLVADLFRAYTTWLNIDLTFQGFGTELTTLPGKYSSPNGALLLARDLGTNEVLGCIAMRPIELESEYNIHRHPNSRCCELKRLYVTPPARGRKVARALVEEVLRIAQDESYDEVFLDTMEIMTGAISLYKSLGFEEIERYYNSQPEGFINMSKKLHMGHRESIL